MTEQQTDDTTTDTEQPAGTEQEQPPAPGQGPPAPETQPDDAQEPQGGSNAEAARYRVQLRETQAERDALVSRVQGYQRTEIERLAGSTLAQPGDLFEVGHAELADLLDPDGNVDAQAVATAVQALIEARPGLHRNARVTGPDFGSGQRGTTAPGGGSNWSDFMRESRQR